MITARTGYKGRVTATREDLGPLLHTALRKMCDSAATSLAWNLIDLIVDHENKAWHEYLNTVWAAIERDKPEEHWLLLLTVKRASVDELRYAGDRAKSALHCAFRLFNLEDWTGYISFIWEDDEDPTP